MLEASSPPVDSLPKLSAGVCGVVPEPPPVLDGVKLPPPVEPDGVYPPPPLPLGVYPPPEVVPDGVYPVPPVDPVDPVPVLLLPLVPPLLDVVFVVFPLSLFKRSSITLFLLSPLLDVNGFSLACCEEVPAAGPPLFCGVVP